MMSPSSAIVAIMESELVSPEGTQVGKNTCHRAATRLQPLPMMSPEETQRCENAGYWPQIEETYIYQRNDFSEPRFLHLSQT